MHLASRSLLEKQTNISEDPRRYKLLEMASVSGSNHGSAAVVRHVQHPTTAALLPSAGGAPAAIEGEHRRASHHEAARTPASSAHSNLGQPMRDDETFSDASFIVSADPDSPVLARPGSLKRDSRSKILPGKRLAVSRTRNATSAQHRRASPAIRGGPAVRGQQTTEDRLRALELQRVRDNAQLANMQQAYN